MSTPRASIVIPLYNLRRWAAEAIDSALAQTLPPRDLQVIVVDDGSTDGSGEVARQYGPRIDYVRQENRGLSAARNTGLRVARAPFVTFLDSDDLMVSHRLERQLAYLADGSADAVIGRQQQMLVGAASRPAWLILLRTRNAGAPSAGPRQHTSSAAREATSMPE